MSAATADTSLHQTQQGLGQHSVKKLYYMTTRGVPWEGAEVSFMPVTTVIDISGLVDLKVEAFSRHRSQQQWTARLMSWINVNQNAELFHRAFSLFDDLPETETDLFAGID
jgi:hypothetical protein